jgi:hypothetical protein
MSFRTELENLINSHSQENGSHTPDFILADYLIECLVLFDRTANARERWYSRPEGWRQEESPRDPEWKLPPIPSTEPARIREKHVP